MDWNKTRETFRTLFADTNTAGMININVPVPETDWNYTTTLEDDDNLLMVIEGDVIRVSDKTAWLHFSSYDAREMAAILLGFADASDARKNGDGR